MLDAKSFIISFWVTLIVCLVLWYRNYKYDKVIAVVFIVISLFQVSNYCILSMVDPLLCGKLVSIILILLSLVFVFSVSLYTNYHYLKNISKVTLVGFLLSLIIILFFSSPLTIVDENGNIAWIIDSSLNLSFIYHIAVIVIAAASLVYFQGFSDISIWVISLYALVTFILCMYIYNTGFAIPIWTYILTSIPLIVWIWGMLEKTF